MAKILLVDDDELVRKVLRVMLESEGHEIHQADDAASAVGLVGSEKPDAVVLDLVIPGAKGLDVCEAIKSRSPETKVLVLSNVPVEESLEPAQEAGADDVMQKPFSAIDLLGRLSRLLETP